MYMSPYAHKRFILSLLIYIFMGGTECIASSRKASIPEEQGSKKRTERPSETKETSQWRIIKPKMALNREPSKQVEKESPSPTPPARQTEKLEGLLEIMQDSTKLKKAMEDIVGIDLNKLINKARMGDREVLGLIGIVSFMLIKSERLLYTLSFDPMEFNEVCETGFEFLSLSEETNDPTVIKLLGFCYLSRPGQENLIKGMKLFKKALEHSRDKTFAFKDPEWAFRRRLVLVETGDEIYLEGDEDTNRETRILIQRYADQGHTGAQCIGANASLTGTGFKKDPKTAVAALNPLATLEKNALAQWILGRAYYNGIGVERNVDLGLKWIFQAALNRCPQAYLFMNSTFPLTPAKNDGKLRFNVKALELYQKAHCISKSHQTLCGIKGYENIYVFESRLSEELYSLLNLKPGFKVCGFELHPPFLEALQSLKRSSFISCTQSDVTWDEANVKTARNFDAFLEEVDALFKAYEEAHDAFTKELELRITEDTEKEKEAEAKIDPQDSRQRRKLASQKEKFKEERETLTSGLDIIRKDREKLSPLIQQLKELIPSTYEDRKRSFLKAYPFFRSDF